MLHLKIKRPTKDLKLSKTRKVRKLRLRKIKNTEEEYFHF